MKLLREDNTIIYTMSEDKPRGILRNKSVTESTESNADRLDRQEVIKNTRLNAQLASESSKGDKIRAKIAEAKAHQSDDNDKESHGENPSDHLHWDEVNLYKTEQEKCATMKIDEPKTPYEGGFNPEGEYYKDDEDEIPEFELGSGEYDNIEDKGSSLNGGKVIKDPSYKEEELKEKMEHAETAEERHKRFEEMRKEHYHMKGNALKQKIEISDDEDDE